MRRYTSVCSIVSLFLYFTGVSSVASQNLMVVKNHQGEEVTCLLKGNRYVPAVYVGKRVVPLNKRVKTLKKQLEGISGKKKVRISRQLKSAKRTLRLGRDTCNGATPDSNEPPVSGTRVTLLTPHRLQSGQPIELLFEPAPSMRFFDNLNFETPEGQRLGGKNLFNYETKSGEPYVRSIDTLHVRPGTYRAWVGAYSPDRTFAAEIFNFTFEVSAADRSAEDSIAQDMLGRGAEIGIFGADRSLLATSIASPARALRSGEHFYVAVDTRLVPVHSPIVEVGYGEEGEPPYLSTQILRIALHGDNQYNLYQTMYVSTSGVCNSTILRPDQSASIAVLKVPAPPHLKYYEYDGTLHFKLNYFDPNTCLPETLMLSIPFDDDPAAPAIPGHSGSPLATARVKIVSFSPEVLIPRSELELRAELLRTKFLEATKDYFAVSVDAPLVLPFINQFNQAKIANWYASVPKTPGAPILDLSDPFQNYIAGLLYYYARPNERTTDMYSVYRPRSGGEDLTLMIMPGLESLGLAAGSDGALIDGGDLYPINLFGVLDQSGSIVSYHYDYTRTGLTGLNDVNDWIATQRLRIPTTASVNTMIHELGHVYWIERGGVSTGDQVSRAIPFHGDIVVQDLSLGLFTRFEYMSYGRNRLSLSNMTYGDEYLEKILKAWGITF